MSERYAYGWVDRRWLDDPPETREEPPQLWRYHHGVPADKIAQVRNGQEGPSEPVPA